MGRVACAALARADGIAFVGGFARAADPEHHIFDDLDRLFAIEKPDVLLDLTVQPGSVAIATSAIAHGVRPVIGATGWTEADRATLATLAKDRQIGAMLVPNFSIGAVLMMRFAQEAARYFPSVEIIEMHHTDKRDAPSGTARLTAERIVAQGDHAHVPIHSVRMQGLVAHQEVILGNTGEILTIRHDSLSRDSFVAGMIAACKAVMELRELVIGLDTILGEME